METFTLAINTIIYKNLTAQGIKQVNNIKLAKSKNTNKYRHLLQ